MTGINYTPAHLRQVERSDYMWEVREYADLIQSGPISYEAFIKRCLLILTSKVDTKYRSTCSEIMDAYVLYTRLRLYYLSRKLRFDRDETGHKKSNQQVIGELVVNGNGFWKYMNQRGVPANESNRIDRGYSWPGVILKLPLVFGLATVTVEDAVDKYEEFMVMLDQIQTIGDYLTSYHQTMVLQHWAGNDLRYRNLPPMPVDPFGRSGGFGILPNMGDTSHYIGQPGVSNDSEDPDDAVDAACTN